MTVTDVNYAILVGKTCDEARPDSLRLYARPAALLDTDADSLRAFVQRYIEQLPVALRTAETSARQLELTNVILPVTTAAENFFTRQCQLSQQGGLLALMDRAYLGHRMLEELNDHLHVRIGVHILHVDMTEANSLVHTLLGEPYVSEIETVVGQTLCLVLETLDSPQAMRYPRDVIGQFRAPGGGHNMESFIDRAPLHKQRHP